MRKFIFSLKSLVMTLALVVGGSAWAQIASLPFVADFSSGEIAPFTGGSGAFVATLADGSKAIAANNGEAYAQFATPYAISDGEEVTVSFQMLNGWLGTGAGNKFAILNDEGVALACIVYDNKSCNINEVVIGNEPVAGFEAFNGQSNAGAKGANGYDNGKGQGFKLNTAETKYNAEVTIKINGSGDVSISIVGGKNNNDKKWSGTVGTAKLNLDKVYITNASNNGDRATGYYGLTITSVKDEVLVQHSFDDAANPTMYPDGSNSNRGTCNYDYVSPIDGTKFLNVWGENNTNGFKVDTISKTDITAADKQWTLEFDWAGYSGCNGKAGQTKLVDLEGNTFFSIDDAAGWGTTFTLSTGQTVACYPCNKATRISANTGSVFTGDDGVQYWHHFTVIGTAKGVTVTVEQYAKVESEITKTIVVKNAKASATNVNPTAIGLRPGSCGSVAINNLKLSVGPVKIVTHDYTVNFIDQNGDPVKVSEVRNAVDGEALAATDADKETIINGKTKYTYVSDDANDRVIDADDIVLNITYEKTTVADYVVNFLDAASAPLKDAVTHKNVLVGSTVEATASELSKMLINGTFFEYASGNTPITVTENEAENVINLVFAPVADVTGYFYNNYEDGSVDWTAGTGGRYTPINADGSKIPARGASHKELQPKVDPETGEPVIDPETGEPVMEEVTVPDPDVPFGNVTRFLTVDQNSRNNNGGAVNKASLAIEQADFTLEAKVLLGSSNNQNGTNLQIKNFAGDANIFKIAQKAEGNTTSWIINDDAENFTVVLPNSGTYTGTDLNNLSNYEWYNLKVTVYNGITFVTITDKEGTAILDKAQVPTQATTYGVGTMQFNSSRYYANFGLDDVTVRSVVVDEDIPAGAEFIAVKINYVDGEGTPVKPADEANFQVGKPIELNSSYTADFKVTEDGEVWTAESEEAPVKKWIYVEDNSADVEVALGAEVNIVFRDVAPRRVALRYQIQKADGTITTKDDNNKNFAFFYDSNKAGDVLFEKDELTFYYPYYFLADGLLYKTGANSGNEDHGVLVIEAGTGTQAKSPITWTPATESVQQVDPETGEPVVDPETGEPVMEEKQIDNAIFAEETENIEGITVVKDGYTQIRMANGATGSAIGSDVAIVTLEPGKYTLTTATRSGTTNFLVDGTVVATIASSGTVTTVTSDEFEVTQTTPLYIQEQNAISQYSDYVLVRKTGAVVVYPITTEYDITGEGSVDVPTSAKEGATVAVAITPNTGYEVESSEITVKDADGADVTVTDGKFTMPAKGVTVNVTATFVQKKIYIETDLTAKFNSLATTKWELSSGQVGWAAPQVTTNSGLTVAAWERYNGSCDWTGDIMYSSVTGLTPGTYKIELYGAAAFTFGRGFGSTAFTGSFTKDTSDTYTENQSITEDTGVTLYAETAEGKVENEIPIWYATNFNTSGIATATLDNVIVGDEGTIKIGLSKTSTSTNWHVVQLKGVTAKILASDALEIAVVAAGMIDDDDVPEALYREIQETIATYNRAYDTAEEYKTAIAALEAVVAKAEAYAPLTEALKEGEEIKENIAEGNPQIEIYDRAISSVKAAYDAVAVADIPAAIAVVQAAITPEFVKAQTAPGSDLTRIVPNAAGNKAVGEDNWKLENALADGEKFQMDDWAGTASGMAVPMIEFWHAPGTFLVSNTIYQTIEGLNPGTYRVTATTAVNNEQTVALNAGSALLFANEGTTDITIGEATSFQGSTGTFTVEGNVGADGKLTFGFKAVEPNYNWLAFKDVELTYRGVTYAINYSDGMVGGLVSGPVAAAEGEEVELTVAPEEGYELASLSVTNEAGDELEVEYDAWEGIATFEMPAEPVFVAPVFQEAYVKVSEFAIGSDGFIEPDGSTKVTGTYTFETAGSYSEMFFGEVVYDVKITAEGLEEPIEVELTGDELTGELSSYVSGLENGKEYTANLVGVHVWDYISFTEIFTKVAELGGVLATTNFTATQTYEISYSDGMVNGTVEGPEFGVPGVEIELTVTPAEGYELASISVTNEAGDELEVEYDAWEGIATFEMPAEPVFVAATFQEAYVKVSDFAIASTGILDEDGDVEIAGTYSFETAGSYSDMFFGEVVYDVQITGEGLAEPIEVSLTGDELNGEVDSYVEGLVEGTQYTANLVGVHVWDYISFTEIFTKVAELGGVLATTQFTVINQPVVEPLIVNLDVERYPGQGYGAQTEEVDFTDALEFLGVDEITTDMLSVVNPDGTTISDYAPYDGWFDGDGVATTWGSTTKINVKFFEAIPNGQYSICDMNGADEVGATYTVRWSLSANDKVIIFNIKVTFVEAPTLAPEIVEEIDVPVVIKAGTAYEGATATFNVEDVTGPLFLDAITEADQYIVNVTDGSFVLNATDGWRDANGDAATWGTGDGMVCVKIQQPASGTIDYIGAIDDTYKDGDTYTAKWGFVNAASNTAVVLNINIIFSDDPTGFAELKAADGVKPNGKYLEKGKIVIWQNGTKFSTSGTIAR